MNELSCVYCYDNGKIPEIAFGLIESELTRDGSSVFVAAKELSTASSLRFLK
jgi:hypothetical protein